MGGWNLVPCTKLMGFQNNWFFHVCKVFWVKEQPGEETYSDLCGLYVWGVYGNSAGSFAVTSSMHVPYSDLAWYYLLGTWRNNTCSSSLHTEFFYQFCLYGPSPSVRWSFLSAIAYHLLSLKKKCFNIPQKAKAHTDAWGLHESSWFFHFRSGL